MELSMDGTFVYLNTHTPIEHELNACPQIDLSWLQVWKPMKVKFPMCSKLLEEEVGRMRCLSGVTALHEEELESAQDEHYSFCPESINRALHQWRWWLRVSQLTPELSWLKMSQSTLGNVSVMSTFQSTGTLTLHLSEQWGIIIATATKTLKKTTQKFRHSAILLPARRYRVDRVFTREKLEGDWLVHRHNGWAMQITWRQ